MKIKITLVLFIFVITQITAQRISKIANFEIDKNSSYKNEVQKYRQNLEKYKKYNNIKEIPKYDRPDLAAEQDYLMTIDPNLGYVPYQRKEIAYNYAKTLLSQKTAISGVEWTERGPNNIGGRTRAIMYDPNDTQHKKVWAGGVSGGLWYNSDISLPTTTWQSVNDFWANIAVTTIAFNPSNTNIFYVGTGEGWSSKMVRGNGIWKTEDAGLNWSQLPSTNNADFNYVQKIVVTSAGRVIAATNAGLYISDDNGATWTQKITDFFADIEIASNGNVFASLGKYGIAGNIFKSTDNGDNWTNITPTGGSPERIEIATAPSNSSIIYAVAANGTIIEWMKKSTNAGTSWTDITIPIYLEQDCNEGSNDYTRGQAWYDLILTVHPTNPNILFAGGIDIHRSTDGGTSWQSITYWTGGCATYVHADQHAMVFNPANSNEAIVGCDGGVFYSNNVGSNGDDFSSRNRGYNVTQYYACAMENAENSNYFLAGAQDNGSHKFTQAGINSVTTATGGDGAYCFIDQDNSQIQITSYVYNNYYLSTNGGSSFSSLTNDYSGSFINPSDYDSNSNILYASDDNDQLFVVPISGSDQHLSINNGIGGAYISNIKISPFTANQIFVGTVYGDIYKITSANTSPTSINLDPNNYLPSAYLSSIDFAQDENHILVTYSNYGVNSVWETTNGGNIWISKEGNLPDMPIRWCLYDPNNSNRAVLATEIGVWSVDDLSATNPQWEPSVEGLANVRCDMIKHRTADNLIAVATYGRGLFTSDIFGDLKPIAGFQANRTMACSLDTVVFTDFTTKNPNAWVWNFTPSTVTFVNGTNVNSQNPEVVFNNVGSYDVSLRVYNADGGDTLVKTAYINVSSNCNYIISNDVTYTCNGIFYDPGYTANYSDGQDFIQTFYPSTPNSMLKAVFSAFNVEFESNCGYDYLEIYDSENASGNLIGQYCGTNNPGTIIATNVQGALTFVFHSDPGVVASGWQATLSCETTQIAPVADFNANITNLCVNNEVQFTDNSTGLPTSWQWSFVPSTITYTNGTNENSQNPKIQFDNTGVYDVTLLVSNANGSNSKTINSYINVTEKSDMPLVSSDSTCQGVSVSLSAVGTNIKWYNISQSTVLGNANTYTPSSSLSPNTYTYYVTQNTNGCESDFAQVTYKVVNNAVANFDYTNINFDYNFNSLSTNASNYYWNFDDGNTSNEINPNHTFPGFGVYNVMLVSSNFCSADTVIQIIDLVNNVFEQEKNDYFIVYPNPTNDKININFTNNLPNSISIINCIGNLVFKTYDVDLNNVVSLNNYTSGVYFLKVELGKDVFYKKIFLNK